MEVDEGDLADELVVLAKGTMGEALLKRDMLPHLLAIASTHFDSEWDEDPTRAIELTIRAAIAGLEDAPFLDGHRLKKQEAAYRLFNLAEPRLGVVPMELDGLDGQRYNYILGDLYKRAGLADAKASTRRVPLTNLRKELVAKLLHPDFPNWPAPRPSVRGMLVRDELHSYYIARPDYEEAIQDLRESGVQRIWLHGDAGTGKTRLAAGAHNDIEEADVPVLRAIDESVLSRSVSTFLTDHGVAAEAINPINIWSLLLDVLSSESCPPIVVFDDMFEGDMLGILARETRSTIVFTSTNLPPSTFNGSSLEVVDMRPDEAEGMIRSRIRNISDDDIEALISVSGGRPLAIEHSCAFVLETQMTVEHFCAAVLDKPAGTLQAAGERYGKTLTAIYQMTLERLASNPRSLWALDLILFSWANSLSPIDLAEVWAVGTEFVGPAQHPDFAHSSTDFDEASGMLYGILPGATVSYTRAVRFLDDASKVEMLGALRQLERYGLIRARADNNISMHQLTRSILRALRVESAPLIFAHLRTEAVKFLRADRWEGGECLPSSLGLWMNRVQEAVRVCWRPMDEIMQLPPAEIAKIAILTAATLRAARHSGYNITYVSKAVPQVSAALQYQFSPDTPDEDRWIVRLADNVLQREFYFDHGVLRTTFNPDFKPAEEYDGTHSAQKQFLWNNARLKYETEWDPVYRDVDLASREAVINVPLTMKGLRFKYNFKTEAADALRISTVYYQQARWNDAIGALEHAWSTYIQVGGDAECTWGALESARRLSRVHLRAGNLNDATFWLMRADETYDARNMTPINHYPIRYAMHDMLTDIRMVQTQNELEFTRAALQLDDLDSGYTGEDLAEFCRSIMPAALRGYDWARQSGNDRFIPETLTYLARLQTLALDVTGMSAFETLRSFFSSNPGLEYQSGLLDIQALTFGAAGAAMTLIMSTEELNELAGEIPDEFRGSVISTHQAERSVIGDDQFATLYKFNQKFGNKYWYAKGLCATFLLADAAGRDPKWLGDLARHVVAATDAIKRPDWVERLETYGETNWGFWLAAY